MEVVTTTLEKHVDFLGFTEEEVFVEPTEFGLSEKEKR